MQKLPQWVVPTWLERLGRASWLALGLVIVSLMVVWLLAATRTITLPLVLAVLVAAVCFPVVDWLHRHRVPRWASALVVLTAIVAITVALGLLVTVQLVDQAAQIEQQITAGLDGLANSVVGAQVSGALDTLVTALQDNWQKLLEGFLPFLVSGIGSFAMMLFSAFIGLNILYYLLADGRKVGHWVGSHMGLPAEVGVPLVRNAVHALQMYFIGTSIVALFNGVTIGLAALVLGTPLAGVLGLLNFFLSYIPYIGAVVGGAVAVLLAIAGGGLTDGLWMLLVVILANSVFQTVIQQLALGATLKLHPLGVLLATTIGGVLGGAIASAVAAPFVAIVLDVVRQIRAAGIFAADPQADDGLPAGEAGGRTAEAGGRTAEAGGPSQPPASA